MSVYNSAIGANQDDSDITIINPSIIHEHNDEYVNNTQITDLQTNNNTTVDDHPNSDGRNDYIFVDHNPDENVKQIEQVLINYIRDLKQESNTQFDCDRQLITRLMDIIRPVYSTNQTKMTELDQMKDEIASLHDKRYIEQKEKIEQLRTEICHYQKMLLTAQNDQTIYNDNKNNSLCNTMQRLNSVNDYDQWTEIEDDAKKLHEIVQSQRNQINEIVTLISHTATATNSLNTTDTTSIDNTENTLTYKQEKPSSNTNMMSTLLKRIQNITGHNHQQQQDEEPVVINTQEEIILKNPSPGISPSESMNTLTDQLIQITSNNQTIENEIEDQEDKPHTPIDIPVVPIAPSEIKKCPVCSHEFTSASDDVEMYDHIEKCLFPSGINTEPKEYQCPNCNRKFPGNDETTYHQHLSDCYNSDI